MFVVVSDEISDKERAGFRLLFLATGTARSLVISCCSALLTLMARRVDEPYEPVKYAAKQVHWQGSRQLLLSGSPLYKARLPKLD
ncbi:MAG: hypothetical protein IPK53_12080 [bacterium]|nr:hypothetical protein [bacterium]